MSSPKMTRMFGRRPAGWAGAGAGCCCAWAVRLGAVSADAAANVVPPSRMLRRLMGWSLASAPEFFRGRFWSFVSSVIAFSFCRSHPLWKNVVQQRGLQQHHLADHVAGLDVGGENSHARGAAGWMTHGERRVKRAEA